MKPEKQELLHDLLGDDVCREATLLAGTQVLRRRRHRRAAVRGLALVLMLAVAAVCLQRTRSPRSSLPVPAALAVVSPVPPPSGALTDDQLLALFPKTPVGLATLSDGRKRLIFPHPGDEKKFITRL